jgi:hypothetical protein
MEESGAFERATEVIFHEPMKAAPVRSHGRPTRVAADLRVGELAVRDVATQQEHKRDGASESLRSRACYGERITR